MGRVKQKVWLIEQKSTKRRNGAVVEKLVAQNEQGYLETRYNAYYKKKCFGNYICGIAGEFIHIDTVYRNIRWWMNETKDLDKKDLDKIIKTKKSLKPYNLSDMKKNLETFGSH